MMIRVEEKISLKEQITLLNKCVNKGLDLNLELKKLGLTYEHLRYRNYEERKLANNDYVSIEDLRQTPKGIPAVSFFSGAGGLDIGFDYAGFNNVASI